VYLGTLGAVRYTLSDKIANVSLKSMSLLGLLLKSVPTTKSSLKADSVEYLQSILLLLLEKIGDNNARVREIAEQSFLMLAKSEIVGPGPAVTSLLKTNKEKSVSQKHTIGRLNLLTSIVEDFRIDDFSVPFQPLVDYAIIGFTNSNSDIRNAAYNLLMAIYGCVGEKLVNIVSDPKVLRPAQIEMLSKGFSEIEVQNFSGSKPQKAKETTKISQKPQTGGMCGFCGKTDPVLENPDNLDIHH
jgi:hypothetical protein